MFWFGPLRWRTTVSALGVVTRLITGGSNRLSSTKADPHSAIFSARSIEYLTAAAFTGLPLGNFSPVRSLNV